MLLFSQGKTWLKSLTENLAYTSQAISKNNGKIALTFYFSYFKFSTISKKFFIPCLFFSSGEEQYSLVALFLIIQLDFLIRIRSLKSNT